MEKSGYRILDEHITNLELKSLEDHTTDIQYIHVIIPHNNHDHGSWKSTKYGTKLVA